MKQVCCHGHEVYDATNNMMSRIQPMRMRGMAMKTSTHPHKKTFGGRGNDIEMGLLHSNNLPACIVIEYGFGLLQYVIDFYIIQCIVLSVFYSEPNYPANRMGKANSKQHWH